MHFNVKATAFVLYKYSCSSFVLTFIIIWQRINLTVKWKKHKKDENKDKA